MNNIAIFAFGMACAGLSAGARADEQAATLSWSYEGKTAPAHWAELDRANRGCAGKEQSPINIEESATSKAALAALDFQYEVGDADMHNNGHTVQVAIARGSELKVGAEQNELTEFHFHTPGEETINGVTYPLVAHLMHRNTHGKWSGVAVLFKQGLPNLALAPLFASLPESGKRVLPGFNPAALLPDTLAYFRYTGSISTPPCTDGVRWHVLKQPVEISKNQIAAFHRLYKMNARPPQALNGRVIESSK
ncbi:MAG: carbonic anhydrase family protein [Pseudomonadota bacterium]